MSCRRKDYKNLDKYRETRKKQKQRYRDRTGSSLYIPKKWEEWEDELVVKHEVSDNELSLMLERSVQAIQVRRWRLVKRENQKDEIQSNG